MLRALGSLTGSGGLGISNQRSGRSSRGLFIAKFDWRTRLESKVQLKCSKGVLCLVRISILQFQNLARDVEERLVLVRGQILQRQCKVADTASL